MTYSIYFSAIFLGVFALLFLAHTTVSAQTNSPFEVQFQYKLEPTEDSVVLDRLMYYISNPYFWSTGKGAIQTSHDALLVNHLEESKNTLSLDKPADIYIDSLCFTIGIDSITNAAGVHEGDLDPIHGMYWTWQSGYINFKLEATSPKSPARKNNLLYHLGGFLEGMRCDQAVCLPLRDQNTAFVVLDVNRFIGALDLSTNYHIMSPGEKAIELSNQLRNSFSLQKQEDR